MHNAALAALGLNWRYLAFEVPPEELRAALAGAKQMGFIGLNLTVPHKLLALPWVDELDASAQLLGAINTVHFSRDATGKITSRGYNTDGDALIQAVQEELRINLRSARVLVLGAGGAARAAVMKLAAEGVIELALVNRTQAKAEALADEVRKLFPAINVRVGYPNGSVDLVLNATSLGLKPNEALPVDLTTFSLARARAAYDMIYRPAETPFLQAAQAAGCQTANGLGMLLHQGARALEIWSGKVAPLAVMRAALEANVYGR